LIIRVESRSVHDYSTGKENAAAHCRLPTNLEVKTLFKSEVGIAQLHSRTRSGNHEFPDRLLRFQKLVPGMYKLACRKWLEQQPWKMDRTRFFWKVVVPKHNCVYQIGSLFSCIQKVFGHKIHRKSPLRSGILFTSPEVTHLNQTFLYISTFRTYSNSVRENKMLAPGVRFSQPCPSAGHRFAVLRSRVDYYRTISSFPLKKKMRWNAWWAGFHWMCTFVSTKPYPTL